MGESEEVSYKSNAVDLWSAAFEDADLAMLVIDPATAPS